jgi:hypothetical protein
VIAELCALALILAVGIPLAQMLDHAETRRGGETLRASAPPRETVSLSRIAGEGFLLGAGICAAMLAVLPWSRTIIVIPLLLIAGVSAWRARSTKPPALRMGWALPFYAIALIALAGYALYATIAPPPEFDYLADWGLKARAFFEVRSIDWQFLGRAIVRDTHSDYPLLLPLLYDFIAVLRNGWNDAYLGMVHVAFAAALLLIIHGTALEETRSSLAAAFITAALVPLAATPWIGMAEGLFIAYATAALLLIRRDNMTLGAILLGLAASTKNEGLTLIAAAALGLVCARRAREVVRLWPAVIIPQPWLIVRSWHRLPTDIVAGSFITRVAEHLRDPRPLIDALSSASLGKPLFWIALAIGIAITSRTLVTRERFVVVTLLLQFACYVGAYVASPYDVAWHVTYSWERLVAHLTPALTYVVLQALVIRQADNTSVSLETSSISN